MILCLFQHRDSERRRLVYMSPVKINAEVGGKDNDDLPEVAKIEFDPSKNADQHWTRIEEKYGKSAYESLITAYVNRIMPSSPDNFKEAILLGSTQRYMHFYDRVRGIFMVNADKLERVFSYSVKEIVGKTKSELGVLRSAVEGGRGMIAFNETMPTPENKAAVEKHFSGYLDAMNGRYFNANVNEGLVIPGYGLPVLDPLLNPDTKSLGNNPAHPNERSSIPIFGIITGSDVLKGALYKRESISFQNKMKSWVKAKLNWMLKNRQTTKNDLEVFKQEITTRYQNYSKIDGNSSIISDKDLAGLNELSKPPLDAIGRVLEDGDDKVIKRLEIMQLLNFGTWSKTIRIAGNMTVQTAINNGSEEEFMAAAKQYGKVSDIDDAISVFEKKLSELSRVGVTETLSFLREFNTTVHSDVLEYEKNVSPKGIAMQVSKQMDYLLGGVLQPHWETDKMIVRFMKASREERHEILGNDAQRDILFRGIALATKTYSGSFNKMVGNREKFKRSIDITKPSADDRAAQLKALEILAHQSKVIVSKLNKTPQHLGKDYIAEIDGIQVPDDDDKLVVDGLRFSAPAGTKPARFRSALDRGGFNTRDLALKGVKVLGLIAVLANVSQSFSETEGELVDRILETAEKSATNQGLLVGAAAAAGAHLAERNPDFLKYPWLSRYHRQKMMVEFQLENIAARLGTGGRDGYSEVKRFTANEFEWQALAHEEITGEKIQELVKEKAKSAKGGAKPVITVEDMAKILPESNIPPMLTRGGRSARMRYLFYEKFFSRPTIPKEYVNRMHEFCTGTSHISKGPIASESA